MHHWMETILFQIYMWIFFWRNLELPWMFIRNFWNLISWIHGLFQGIFQSSLAWLPWHSPIFGDWDLYKNKLRWKYRVGIVFEEPMLSFFSWCLKQLHMFPKYVFASNIFNPFPTILAYVLKPFHIPLLIKYILGSCKVSCLVDCFNPEVPFRAIMVVLS